MMVPYALIRRVCVRLSVAASSIFSAGLRRRLSGGVGVGRGRLRILLLPPLFHFLGRPLSPSALGGRRGGRFIHRLFRGVIHGLRRLAPGVALNGRGGGRLRRGCGGLRRRRLGNAAVLCSVALRPAFLLPLRPLLLPFAAAALAGPLLPPLVAGFFDRAVHAGAGVFQKHVVETRARQRQREEPHFHFIRERGDLGHAVRAVFDVEVELVALPQQVLDIPGLADGLRELLGGPILLLEAQGEGVAGDAAFQFVGRAGRLLRGNAW